MKLKKSIYHSGRASQVWEEWACEKQAWGKCNQGQTLKHIKSCVDGWHGCWSSCFGRRGDVAWLLEY